MGEATATKRGHITDILGIKIIQDGSSVKEISTKIEFVESLGSTPIIIPFYGLIDSRVFGSSITYTGKASCGENGRKIIQSFSFIGERHKEVKSEAIFHDPNNKEEISEKDLESLLYSLDIG